MEFRITLDDDITSSVNSLAALFDLASENGDEVLQYCYDHYDDFLLWLNSVDNNRAKILSACQRQIGEYGLEYFSFVLKAKAKSVGLIDKKWEKDHLPQKEIRHISKPDKTKVASNRKSDSVDARPWNFPSIEIPASYRDSHALRPTDIKDTDIPAFLMVDGRVCTTVNNDKTVIVRGTISKGRAKQGVRVRLLPAGEEYNFFGEIVGVSFVGGEKIPYACHNSGEIVLRIDIYGSRAFSGIRWVLIDSGQSPVEDARREYDHVIVQKENEALASMPFSLPDGRVIQKFGNGIIVRGMFYGEVKERMLVKVLPLGNKTLTGEILEILNDGLYISKASLDRGEVVLRIKLFVGMRSFGKCKKVSVFKY